MARDDPGVHQVLERGLDLPTGVTLLVGENGSGKSTIVEAVAMAFGLSGEGGTRHTQHAAEHELALLGAQVLCGTHSPLLAALPGANILEVGDGGIREPTYDNLELVSHWRSYLAEPMRCLHHIL